MLEADDPLLERPDLPGESSCAPSKANKGSAAAGGDRSQGTSGGGGGSGNGNGPAEAAPKKNGKPAKIKNLRAAWLCLCESES